MNEGSLKEVIETIAKALVDAPDEVTVREIDGDQATVIELKVASGDLGKVIGKQGRIANALRTVVKSVAMKDKKKVYVEIIA